MTFKFLCLAVLLSHGLWAQEALSFQQAVDLALEQNYNIRVASKDLEQARNNADIKNSGFLPSVSANGNAAINYQGGENRTVQGDFTFDPAESYNYSASLNVDYTIYNGRRLYDYRALKEAYALNELQVREVIENTILELSAAYYDLARLTESTSILKQTLAISEQRLKRAEYNFSYGQSTQLEVLNAEVDLNNDSINLLNSQQQLENARRNVNLMLGRDLSAVFNVDTTVSFVLSQNLDELLNEAKDKNVILAQNSAQIRQSVLSIKSNKAGWLPNLNFGAAYLYNASDNPNGAFLVGNQSNGPQAVVSLTWNIFDGGASRTQTKNAKVRYETTEIQKEQNVATIQRDVMNAHSSYINALYVLKAQEGNVRTTQRNFERSENLYKRGQINSIDFRQAQINMLNAHLNRSEAKYNAKIAELQLKQLAGVLLEK